MKETDMPDPPAQNSPDPKTLPISELVSRMRQNNLEISSLYVKHDAAWEVGDRDRAQQLLAIIARKKQQNVYYRQLKYDAERAERLAQAPERQRQEEERQAAAIQAKTERRAAAQATELARMELVRQATVVRQTRLASLDRLFVDVCRERMTELEFSSAIKEARQRQKAEGLPPHSGDNNSEGDTPT